MAMNARTKHFAGLGLKLATVVIPALLAYWQARSEAKDKAKGQERDLAAAYSVLAKNVEEMQTVVKKDHDELMTLRGFMHFKTSEIESPLRLSGRGTGAGRASADAGVASASAPPDLEVRFKPLPSNVGAAREQMAKELR
jgi:hypothetical protein